MTAGRASGKSRRHRAVILLFLLVGAILLATLQTVWQGPPDAAELAWFAAAFLWLICAMAYLLWRLLRPLWRRDDFNRMDGTFWVAFLAMPVCFALLYAVTRGLLSWWQ